MSTTLIIYPTTELSERVYHDRKKGRLYIWNKAFVTLIHGDAKIFLIGSIEIDKLLVRFKENMAQIQKKSKEVFERYSDEIAVLILTVCVER